MNYEDAYIDGKPIKEKGRIRKPDYDLESYLQNNIDFYTLDDIKNIHAEVAGANDELHWYWVIELNKEINGGRFVLTDASCDYTGWDCQSGGESWSATTASKAAELAPEQEEMWSGGRGIRRNLLAQVKGTQPFGLYVP